MRVTGGDFKGRNLLTPRTLRVRPTSDRVRQSLFNILKNCSEFKILDLFAGVGSVGLEALSRGADHGFFVDNSHQSLSFIKRNTLFCRDKVTILPVKMEAAISLLQKRGHSFDLIFVDPPYEQGYVKKTLDLLKGSSIVKEGCQLVVQHSKNEAIEEKDLGFSLVDQRTYGASCLSFLN